jgi:arylsulfatase A-like enzyme
MRFSAKLFTVFRPCIVLAACLISANVHAAGKATHVVVIVWDGMRPDFVTPETTPALWKLASQGVIFKRHHPVYISSTEVNGTALATGAYPQESGIVGNNEFRPAINASKPIMTAEIEAVRQGDAVTGDQYLAVPTMAERLHQLGLHTAVAGAKTVALLQDRAPRPGTSPDITLFEGNVLPENLSNRLTTLLGKFPAASPVKTNRDLWTTQALTGLLWEKGVPALSVLWLSEPDATQHATGPGSEASLAAIRSSDDNLARVLAALKQQHAAEQTDVIIVSDHGFSTIATNADIAALLKQQGFSAARELPATGDRPGDILVVSNGGTAFLYVVGHDSALIEKVVHWLQIQPFAGVVFTRKPVEGTFSLADARISSASAPDIALSMRWWPDKSSNGTPGLLALDARAYRPGQGSHASLSPFDMHNTCVAAGPDFRRGFADDLPTGNIDIAPTVLWILGAEPKSKLSGRVLCEALAAAPAPVPVCHPHHLEASWRTEDSTWRQYLDSSEVNGTLYLDQGNGELSKSGSAVPKSGN